MQFKAIFLAAAGLLGIAAVPHHPGAPVSSLDNQRAVGVVARDVNLGAQSIDANNINVHDRLESIVDQLTPIGVEKGQGGNDNEALVARVPQTVPVPLPYPSTNTNFNHKFACTLCILQGRKCDEACKGNEACSVFCHCWMKQEDAGCKLCRGVKPKCTYTGPDHNGELEDASSLSRRAPQVPNMTNAPPPFLACDMCENYVNACEKTCKGNSACGIYCRCQAKATNIACMVCNTWYEDCDWEGQDHWVEVVHGSLGGNHAEIEDGTASHE